VSVMTSGSDPKNPKKEQPEGDNKERPSSDDRSSSSPILRSVIDIPQTVIDEFNRQDREQARREEKQIFWNRLGVFAVIAYGAVAFVTWLALLNSNSINRVAATSAKDSADAAIGANRAWIVPSTNRTWMVTGTLAFEFDWINAGKTPAVHIRETEDFIYDRKANIKQGCERYSPYKGGQGFFMPFVMANESFAITPMLPMEWVKATTTWVAIHGCVTYVDVLTNRERSTEFCFEVDKNAMLPHHIYTCSSVRFGINMFSPRIRHF